MGISQCNYTDSRKNQPLENQQILTPPIHSKSLSLVSNYDIDDDEDDDFDNYNELKFKSLLMKMIWDFGFGCFVPFNYNNKEINRVNFEGKMNNNPEHNKAWLLAESGGDLANGEPHSVHSSFRFSLCSQVELDSMKTANLASSTTILMVNLDNNYSDSNSKELKCRRIESLEKSISPIANSLIRFSYGEILSATRNLSEGRVLGRGALSYVFRGRVGFLRTAVAVKRLDKEDNESPKAFCRELMIASSLQHPNIVPLLGYCVDPDEGLFLIYKYVSSGSLERHLHGKKKGVKGFASLSWSARYKVAIGIAEAVAYLHNGTEKCIVHRDIKPSNILLSSKKRPKLCDFGLATWTPAPSVPFLCKTVKGTFGLNKMAKPLMDQGESAYDSLLDPRAKLTPKSSKLIAQMVRAAAACVSNEECSRPSINEAIILLRGEGCLLNNKGKASLGSRRVSYVPQILQRTKSEMKSHLALAMLGVSELDDDDFLYGR
ncbi:hypothetical protein RDABS01_037886 [Bienertia sinuspersici]